MNDSILPIIYVASSILLSGGVFVRYGLWALHRRRRGRDEVLRNLYLRILMQALVEADEKVPNFPMFHRSSGRRLLVETVAETATVLCGSGCELLQRVSEYYGLPQWLLKQARRSMGYRRARVLALLSRLPLCAEVAGAVERYRMSRNRCVRFYTLSVQLSADPTAMLRRIADYPNSFSSVELAEILALLRRGMLPIAYEPLLGSSVLNLRMVGLGIVRQFGIEEAESRLLQLVADDAGRSGQEALRIMCALHRPLMRAEILKRLGRMDGVERRRFLRNMALEGYATGAMCKLFNHEECSYYESLVKSHKSVLV